MLRQPVPSHLISEYMQAAAPVLLQRYGCIETSKLTDDDSPQAEDVVASFNLWIGPSAEQIATLVEQRGETLEMEPFTKAEMELFKSRLCRSA